MLTVKIVGKSSNCPLDNFITAESELSVLSLADDFQVSCSRKSILAFTLV